MIIKDFGWSPGNLIFVVLKCFPRALRHAPFCKPQGVEEGNTTYETLLVD